MTGQRRNGKIRILLLSQTMDRGGLEEIVYATAAGLDKTRFDICVAYFFGGSVADRLAPLPGVNAIRLTGHTRLARFRELWLLVRRLRIDLLHNHFCWYGLPVAALAGVVSVETVHNRYTWLSPLQRRAYSVLCRLAGCLVAVSDPVREYTLEHFPGSRRRPWTVIHNGIDVDRFRRRDVRDLRASLRLGNASFVVGFCGRLEPEKGVEFLVEAMRILAPRIPGIRLVVAGTGSMEQELKQQVATRGPAGVVFTGHRADMGDVYSLFDLFVLPSLYEGLPLALLEAMAAGCPVVASPAAAAVVTDGVDGYVVDPHETEFLAARIELLARDGGLRERMGGAAVETVTRRYSSVEMIRNLEALYERLSDNREPSD